MVFQIPIYGFYVTIGVIIGCLITSLILFIFNRKNREIAGVIEVDEYTKICKFHITTLLLEDPNTKQATFTVIHNVDLSREEQSL